MKTKITQRGGRRGTKREIKSNTTKSKRKWRYTERKKRVRETKTKGGK